MQKVYYQVLPILIEEQQQVLQASFAEITNLL
jgi:hypothetical protein